MKVENIAINLRIVMHELGMSQSELSEKSKLTQAAISQILSGKRIPSLESLLLIMRVIPVKFERLVR